MYDLDYFDQKIMLCVDKRYDQLTETTEQFDDRNIHVEWFMTGEGDLLPETMYKKIDDPFSINNQQKCYRNFQEIFRQAEMDKPESLLLFEDDVLLTDKFDEVLDKGLRDIEKLQIKWDVLFLGANHEWGITEEITPNLLRLHGGSYCFHGIAFNNQYKPMTRIMADATICPYDYFVAHYLQPNPDFNIYALWPNEAVQRPGQSHIVNEGSYQDYGKHFIHKGKPYVSTI